MAAKTVKRTMEAVEAAATRARAAVEDAYEAEKTPATEPIYVTIDREGMPAVGSVIEVSPERAERWCREGLAVRCDGDAPPDVLAALKATRDAHAVHAASSRKG